MNKWHKITATALFGTAIWLFWWLQYPQALEFREQNQLFLYTWDFLWQRLSLAGGLADYIGEFITQFACTTWLGALLVAALLTVIQILVWKAACALKGSECPECWYPLSFIPSVLLLLHMGNIDVTMSFPVAVATVLAAYLWYCRSGRPASLELVLTPVLYWTVGPLMWLYVAFCIGFRFRKGFSARSMLFAGAALAFAAACVFLFRYTLLAQYTDIAVWCGINYFCIPLRMPALQAIVPATTFICIFAIALLPAVKALPALALQYILIVCAMIFGVKASFDKDEYQIIAFDQLVRQEKWNELIDRAKEYQPKSEVACVSLNLSLYLAGRFNEVPDFWQAGSKGLLMPRVRDYISNSSTCETFWRLGMVNEALRYAFDTQESIPNLRKSGRWMSRMAQCQIVNGRYDVASKYLDILSHSLYYGKWAKEQKAFLHNEEKVCSDPVYAYLRSVRSRIDYLFYYPEMEKMLTLLYSQNKANVMAANYALAWRKLGGYKE